MAINAWGREVPDAKPTDLLYVDEEDRLDVDDDDPNSDSNALDDSTGDDIGEQTPADFLEWENEKRENEK